MRKPKVLVFASGTPAGGGSGFENLVRQADLGDLGRFDAHIVGVVSNYREGGVSQRALRRRVRFFYFPAPWDTESYQRLAAESGADFFLLSGWLKYVVGLDPARTFNIHPGNLPRFGGGGMHGARVHEATMSAFWTGTVQHSAVCMHFISPHNPKKACAEQYDRGPVFLRQQVLIKPSDTAETLARRVHKVEHLMQPEISNLVVHGEIRWDGKRMRSLRLPSGYRIDRCPEEAAAA